MQGNGVVGLKIDICSLGTGILAVETITRTEEGDQVLVVVMVVVLPMVLQEEVIILVAMGREDLHIQATHLVGVRMPLLMDVPSHTVSRPERKNHMDKDYLRSHLLEHFNLDKKHRRDWVLSWIDARIGRVGKG
jgi:hypothetical protein